MGDDAPDPLVAWGVGTFHAAFFLTALVALLHAGGNLGVIGGLDTARGFALGAILWAASVWATRRALRGVGVAGDGLSAPAGDVAVRAFAWGAVTGVIFLVGLLVVLAGQDIVENPRILLVLLVGIPVALVVGGVVGLLLSLVDLAAARVVRALN